MEGLFKRHAELLATLYDTLKRKSIELNCDYEYYHKFLKEWKKQASASRTLHVEDPSPSSSTADVSIITQQQLASIEALLQKAQLMMQHVVNKKQESKKCASEPVNMAKGSCSKPIPVSRRPSKIPVKTKLQRDKQNLSLKVSTSVMINKPNNSNSKMQSDFSAGHSLVDSVGDQSKTVKLHIENANRDDQCNVAVQEDSLARTKSTVQAYQHAVATILKRKKDLPREAKKFFYEEMNKHIASCESDDLKLCQKYNTLASVIEKDWPLNEKNEMAKPKIDGLMNRVTILDKSFKELGLDSYHKKNFDCTSACYSLKENSVAWYPTNPLNIPSSVQYTNKIEVATYAWLILNIQWLSFLLDFKRSLAKDFFPLLESLDPREEEFLYLFRGLYSLLCEDGCKLPVFLEITD